MQRVGDWVGWTTNLLWPSSLDNNPGKLLISLASTNYSRDDLITLLFLEGDYSANSQSLNGVGTSTMTWKHVSSELNGSLTNSLLFLNNIRTDFSY